jgi:hypothetical protein
MRAKTSRPAGENWAAKETSAASGFAAASLPHGTAYARIIDHLRAHGKKVRETRPGQQAMAQCPAHEDRNPSLSITGIEGQVLAYCHAGCPIEAVLDALGMTKSDLYDDTRGATYVYEVAPGQIQPTAHRNPEKKFWQTGDTQSQPILYRLRK